MKRILSVTVICALLLTCCASMSSCGTLPPSKLFDADSEESPSENTTGVNFANENRYENSGFQMGSGTQDDPFIICTVEDLENLRELINGDRHDIFCTASFSLGNDIDLQNKEWTPIGVFVDRDFRGTFDGHGYSILNFKITTFQSNADVTGLFGTSTGVIKNLTVSGFNIDLRSDNYVTVGGIVGNSYGANSSISNCHVTNGKVRVISKSPANIGGICGTAQETDITKCSSSATVHGESTLKSGENASQIPDTRGGSIVGSIFNGSISHCTSDGDISMSSANYCLQAGGIVGAAISSDISSSDSSCRIKINSSYSSGDYQYTCGYAGGICGEINGGTISRSFHSGNISVKGSSNYYVGGLAGWLNGDIVNSYATSKISLNAAGLHGNLNIIGAFIGGLAGFAESGRISACYSSGSIEAWFKYSPLFTGGLIGIGYSDVVLSDCLSATNIATAITAYESAPSIPITLFVGYFSGEYCYDVTLDNCYRSTSASLEGQFASLFLPANECYIEPYASSGLSSCETSRWNAPAFYQNTLGWDTKVWNLRNNSLPTLYRT